MSDPQKGKSQNAETLQKPEKRKKERIYKQAKQQFGVKSKENNVEVVATEEVKDWLAEIGYKPEFGAREMSRVIHREVKLKLANFMLFGELQHGGVAKLILEEKDGKKTIAIEAEPNPPEEDNADEPIKVNEE